MCFNCFSTLYLFHKFKRRCLRSEEDLRLYIRERPHCATANLKDVLKCGYARDQDVELHPSQQKGKTMQRPRKTTSAGMFSFVSDRDVCLLLITLSLLFYSRESAGGFIR